MTMQDFVHGLNNASIPDSVLRVVRRSFLDTLGVAAVGSRSEMALAGRKSASALFGPSPDHAPRLLFNGQRSNLFGAAMVGAITIDSIDAHDGTSPCKGHAGSAVFPALFALMDANKSVWDGPKMAAFLASAYEVSYRVGLTQHATCPDYHTSGAWTAVGVAAATAGSLGADAATIANAAGIAEYHGPRSQMMRCIDYPTMVRDGVGWGAPTGVSSTVMAMNGFTGGPALTCEGVYWEDLGQTWRVVQDTHYKPYPCCRWAHPSIDAAKDLMSDHNLTAEDIVSVEIKTFHNATRLAGHRPTTPDEFAYSIAFPVACMIVRGQIGLTELESTTLTDPEILRISNATTLIDDPHLTAISDGVRWAQVDLGLKDGRTLSAEPRRPRGDPDMPLTDAEISEKFHLFADPVIGSKRANELENLAGHFDTLDVHQTMRLMDIILTAYP